VPSPQAVRYRQPAQARVARRGNFGHPLAVVRQSDCADADGTPDAVP
jgi:hypothetical protein